ncbi:MAG: ATP-dependent Clp protease proteolytic subunit [Pseudomonadota bacterium]
MSEKPQPPETPSVPAVSKHLFDARKILITGGIDDEIAREVVSRLFAMAHVSSDPITVFVSSPGGHVESGDMIHDAIKFIEPEVKMVGTGWVASAGALIYAAAKKENRYSLPNTRFLLHQPSGGMRGTAEDISIQAKEIIRMRERLNKIFAAATGQSLEKVEEDTDRDFWMSAEEAVEYGLATHIISSVSEIK